MTTGRAQDLPEAPAAERNKQPILDVLVRVLPRAGLVLEIASGTGQHVVHFAAALPGLTFQPTEAEVGMLGVIRRRVAAAALANVHDPIALDVHAQPWPIEQAAAIVVINLLHIAPPSATSALLDGAENVLSAGAPLVVYGPFVRAGVPTAPSNIAFDGSLRARNPEWGLRELDQVAAAAAKRALDLEDVVECPANNIVAVFRRR